MISVLTPAFNEEANLEVLHRRLAQAMAQIADDWEWIVVDDHSRDGTFRLVQQLATLDGRVKGIRLARNSGSHVAMSCALHHARGAAAIVMAADLQDPPEMIGPLVDAWRGGAQIVWAVRRERPGHATHARFAAIYYWIMRTVVGMKEMPARGADFFLADRVVVDAFTRFRERHGSVLALLTSLGFRQAVVEYDKEPRREGRSGWTLARKIGLVIDSITGFSAAPLRFVSMLGIALCLVATLVAVTGALLLPSLGGGLLLLLAAIIAVGGLQLLATGIVGEYVWRALEEARHRPPYLIEEVAGIQRPAHHTVE